MAILRFGPWSVALSGAGAINPITDFTSPPLGFSSPVNIAKTDWPNQEWGAVYLGFNSGSYVSGGVVGLGDTASVVDSGFGSELRVRFFYQTADDISVDFNWGFVNSAPDVNGSFFWNKFTIEGNTESDSGSGVNGSESINLEPSALGLISVSVQLPSGFGGTIEISFT